MDSQPECFEDLPGSPHPRRDVVKFRAGGKIIDIPCSVWKDGRIRADLSKYGAGEVVSRKRTNLNDRIARILAGFFEQAVEALYVEFRRPAPRTHRQNNKLALRAPTGPAPRYINPFSEHWNFAKCPDWLFERRELTPTEKHLYGRLMFPREVCERYDKTSGIIIRLKQEKLAESLGVRRETANKALRSLEARRLIKTFGGRGGRGQDVRFLWHEWMPSCALNAQLDEREVVRPTGSSCAKNAQEAVRSADPSCTENAQHTLAIEKRETAREEREARNSRLPWYED